MNTPREASVIVLLGALVLASHEAAWGQPCQGWNQTASSGPSPRLRPSMAYDSARGVTVLFGGYDGGRQDDTWEYDGVSWVLRTPASRPPALDGHNMVYDSARGVSVLFEQNGETYEWDGSSWRLSASTGPAPRSGAAMAYDSVRGVTVLFGGGIFPGFGDTWEWDGVTWTLKSTGGPSPRSSALAFDSTRGVTVLFGGYGTWYKNDTWEWDGISWQKRHPIGALPKGRSSHGLAYDSARHVTVLFGGWTYDTGTGHLLGDTWEWDGYTWAERTDTEPSDRSDFDLAYDSGRAVTVLFGGYGYLYQDDTWEWNGAGPAVWTKYGSGWPGTNYVPMIDVAGNPAICSTITLNLANSRGATTTAALVVGLLPIDQPTAYDGHLLVKPFGLQLLSLPAAGLAIPAPLPCDSIFCGRSIYLQALELDPGASQGVSFTCGLRLVLGSP